MMCFLFFIAQQNEFRFAFEEQTKKNIDRLNEALKKVKNTGKQRKTKVNTKDTKNEKARKDTEEH